MRLAVALSLAVLALSGCGDPAPERPQRFRDTGVPIYSNAVTAPSDLAGRWHQVAEFAAPGAPRCGPGGVTVALAGNGLTLDGDLCRDGRRERFGGTAEVIGPGRLRVQGEAADWWLLWVDVDVRTLVIGTPSGAFGFILNREPGLPADRATAAREILQWNGYDLSRLRPVP